MTHRCNALPCELPTRRTHVLPPQAPTRALSLPTGAPSYTLSHPRCQGIIGRTPNPPEQQPLLSKNFRTPCHWHSVSAVPLVLSCTVPLGAVSHPVQRSKDMPRGHTSCFERTKFCICFPIPVLFPQRTSRQSKYCVGKLSLNTPLTATAIAPLSMFNTVPLRLRFPALLDSNKFSTYTHPTPSSVCLRRISTSFSSPWPLPAVVEVSRVVPLHSLLA